MEWKIELLGGLRLTAQGKTLTRFRTQRAGSLLAYLCLHPRQHSRDALADLFWGQSEIEAARTSLRQALSQIRHALKEAHLAPDTLLHTCGNNTVGIHFQSVATDVAAFLEAVESKQITLARQLYGGPLLPGYWDEWLLEERERLETLFQSLGEPETGPVARLPAPFSRFFGREEELERLRQWLAPESGTRFVTLLGTGGVGKTRLALLAAQSLLSAYGQRVAFVPLAALTDARLLLDTIREVLGIPVQPHTAPLDQLTAFLAGEPYLLALDNLEQLAASASAPLSALLSRLPNLTCIATSRRRLGLTGERQLTLAPLALDESMGLFCDLAGVAPGTEVAQLCTLLEGVPLSLELAAARIGTLTVPEMVARIGERLSLLTTQTTDKSSRHRSLHATMEWSVRLLTQEQRRFFAALSVFHGGWTTEAAAEICVEPDALEFLSQLRDRSLIHAQEEHGALRWQMLESLREFGSELLSGDESTDLVTRHRLWFENLVRENDDRLLGACTGLSSRYDAELPNFRMALKNAEPQAALTLASYLVNFWILRNHLQEGIAWLDYFHANAPELTTDRLRLLIRGQTLLNNAGKVPEALKYCQESVSLARQFGDNHSLVSALRRLGDMYSDSDDLEKAQDALEEAIQHVETEDDMALRAECEAALGWLLLRRGELEASARRLNSALEYARAAHQTHMTGVILHRLATLYLALKENDKVQEFCRENIEIQSQMKNELMLHLCYGVRCLAFTNDKEFESALSDGIRFLEYSHVNVNYPFLRMCFSNFVNFFHYRDQKALVAPLVGFCYALSEWAGLPASDEHLTILATTTEVRAALGDAVYTAGVAQGQAMSLEEAATFLKTALRPDVSGQAYGHGAP